MENLNRVGEKHITNENYTVEIIEYFNYANCKIQFESGNIIENRSYADIKNGSIKNPYHKSVFNIGFIGTGKYSKRTHIKIYQTWQNMLARCYSEIYQTKNQSYKGCSVDKYWYNFQVFAEWYEKYYTKNSVLDKDIFLKEIRFTLL
jgi:hypothetical protein